MSQTAPTNGAKEQHPLSAKIVKEKGLEGSVQVKPAGCMGACNQGPLIEIFPEDAIYQYVTADNLPVVVESHLVNKVVCQEHLLFSDRGPAPEFVPDLVSDHGCPRTGVRGVYPRLRELVESLCCGLAPCSPHSAASRNHGNLRTPAWLWASKTVKQ